MKTSVHFGHEGYIASDRNNGIYFWLENDNSEYFIQIDEDMIPPIDIWRLAESVDAEHPLVAAPYLFVGDQGFTVSGQTLDATPVLPGAGLQEVEWFGTGVWATSRAAMIKMAQAEGSIVKFDVNEKGAKRRGSDVFLCTRARSLGLRCWLNRDFIAGHRKGPTFAPLANGEVATLPWGTFWEGADVPADYTAKREIRDIFSAVVKKYGKVEV